MLSVYLVGPLPYVFFFRSPDRPARSLSLYRLSYPAYTGGVHINNVSMTATVG